MVAGLAGIGFAVVIVAANLIAVPAGLPSTGADPGAVAAFFSAQRVIAGVSAALTPAAWLLATVFGAGVLAVVLGRDTATTLWAVAGFAGVLLQNAAFAAVIALRVALGSPDGDTATLWRLHETLFTLNGAFLALALIGFTLAGRAVGLLRRWQGGIGLTAAALLFTSATFTPMVVEHGGGWGLLGLAGWLLWVVWLIGYGVALMRTPAATDR